MSKIENFRQQLLTDTNLQQEALAAAANGDFAENMAALGAKHGHSFTADDVNAEMAKLKGGDVASGSDMSAAAMSVKAGCGTSSTLPNPSYTMDCGASTQRCLCTL
ncbi:Nif11 family protein [Mucilaginibacter sp. 14171R-50]|uniref:Nif11 family protein n=1 Tax=Mucilaginibacter sp. 14171R-50 TaxID=2703789 RepID=UPI00138D290B|nr:Nif11 family protein [Mucilaginibacter sp. 14171R-50]QHS56044.1 Nif11 family protein [Mucilaginibacter sp. 14171R-50]